MNTFHIVSLGCPKNLVDSEVIYGQLIHAGWIGCDEPEQAEVLIVNTCGFIQPAVEESIDEILQCAQLKESYPDKKLVVTGCLVQRYRERLRQELPEVDLFVGTEGVEGIDRIFGRHLSGDGPVTMHLPGWRQLNAGLPRRLSTPFFRGWLKVTEGCDNRCSYCMIPSIRGPLRSRPVDDLVNEARALEEAGVKELSLAAQDLTAYGRDIHSGPNLVDMLVSLLERTTIPWIRMMYLYPSGISEELLDLVAAEPRIVPYFDIPLQHVSDPVLKAMNRRYTRADCEHLIGRIRHKIPDAALRTTLIVGFPGESDRDFDRLVDFVEQARFDHLGVFAYANEEGCPAERFPDQVEESVKEQRVDTVARLQAAISAANIARYIGTVQTVLVEGISRETDLLIEGRTRYQAPDIDGCVLINEGETSPGEFVEVTITEAQVYDLVGGIVS